MDYIQITKDNIEKEHICCAMSGKQSVMKKEWLKQRFAEGLVFTSKGFIFAGIYSAPFVIGVLCSVCPQMGGNTQ